MLKAAGKRKFANVSAEELEQEHEENELEAELNALEAMRAEKAGKAAKGPAGGIFPYNKEGLLKAADSLKVASLPFAESMQICDFEVTIANDNDDLEREIAFYNQTLLAVQAGKERLAAAGIAVRRPDDFFCESVKSDVHMSRVKDRLILEEKKIDAFEKRKQREVNRKYEKQVSALKKQENAGRVKAEINEVTKFRKSSSDDPKAKRQKLSEVLSGGGSGDKGQKGPHDRSKRQIMDKKYGSGIKQAMRNKLTDKKSLNDFKDFHPRGGKFIRREKKTPSSGAGGRGKPGAKPNRPGKETRNQKRSNKK